MEQLKIYRAQFENFRNLSTEIIELSSGINCIFGQNGNGKTNILEAIYFTGNRKSFRKKTSYTQLLSSDSGKNEIIFRLLAKDSQEKQLNLSYRVSDKKFECFENGEYLKTKPKFGCIFIGPFDSYAFHHEPSFRRNWLDYSISQINISYKKILKSSNQLTRQRNALLKKKPRDFLSQIKSIDEVLVEHFQQITNERIFFLSEKTF